MDKEILAMLARKLNLTGLEDEKEPYILTPEEEKEAIAHEVSRLRSHKAWRLKEMGLKEGDIDVRLDAINFEDELSFGDILERANSNKQYSIWQENQRVKDREKKEAEKKEIKELCTAAYLFRLMKWTSKTLYGKDLIVNSDNKKLITAVCYFISEDPRFETEFGYSFKKGLLIRGIAGLGKTHIVRCVEGNPLNPILTLSMLEISDVVKHEGDYEINLAGKKVIYLDDVGTEEPVVVHFGTRIAFFKNFIESYYLKTKQYNRLILSTNNSFDEIESRYGFRVRSRLKEMVNIIDVTGKDMRK